MGDTVCVIDVPSVAVSDEQVGFVPVYHWYEYGVVPPDALAVSVIVSPLSMLGLEGEIAPAIRPELTVTVSDGEHDEEVGVPCDESETL